MRRNRKLITAWFLILLAAMTVFCSFASGEYLLMDEYPEDGRETDQPENLIYNGDFELIDSDGIPEGWYISQYHSEEGISEFSSQEDPAGVHGKVAEIRNISSNDARLEQYVWVKPDTIYCLSGYVWADDIRNGHGANLSIGDIYSFSEKVYDTGGQWKYIEYYGSTGPEQDLITVYIRVGGYGGESIGRARFDNIVLREVWDEAEAVDVAAWYNTGDGSGSGLEPDSALPVSSDVNPNGKPFYTVSEYYGDHEIPNASTSRAFLILAGAGYLALFLFCAAFFRGKKSDPLMQAEKRFSWFLPLLILAFAVRLVLSWFVEGYSVDVGCFTAWGSIMKRVGPLEFYPYIRDNHLFCDYPPLYMYILGQNAVLTEWIGGSEAWSRVIYRLIPALCDVLSCWLIYRHAFRNNPEYPDRIRVILLLFALNPAAILNSAAWGQIDSVLCLLLLMVALCAINGKWQAALPIYALSVLVKPQALMLGILGLVFIIIAWIRNREHRKPILLGTALSILAMAAIIIPFGIYQPAGWLIQKYRETLNSYPYATVNTANYYYLFGGNWNPVGQTARMSAVLLLGLGCGLYGLWWHRSSRNRPYGWIETILSLDFAFLFVVLAVMKVSWGTAGAVAMAFAFLITISFAIRKKDIRFLMYLGALLFILLYVFGVKMHERYVFPAIFLLAGAWCAQRDRRILYLLGLFSVTLFINEGIVLDNSIRFGSDYGHLLSGTQVIVEAETGMRYFLPHTVVIADILSILNIGGAIYALHIARGLLDATKETENRFREPMPFPDQVPAKRSPLSFHPDRSLHWNKTDTWILVGITALYSVVSLLTLGSTKAPQNGWTSSSPDEEIIFDLGSDHQKINILYFGRISSADPTDFTLSQSDDLLNWSEEVYAKMNYGEYWKWQYVVSSFESGGSRTYSQSLSSILNFQCRFIKLRAGHSGLRLNEVLFRDQNGNTIPASIYSRSGGNPDSVWFSDPERLLDEQDTLEALPDLVDGQNGDNPAPQPSWWNSTYFDEIYHARTAFEFLHPNEIRHGYNQQPEPYESTHPPLGKLLISASVAIFGMTPFGWRFAGAVAGILMLPGMYLLGKQLTKKTSIAAFVTALVALDCMHLTQTQIATIDSFPVLFIIFSYFFMLRYIQTDTIRLPLRSSLIPLGFSGLFMGLAIASKWIGLYAGAGLAVLFFWHGFRMIRICREANDLSECGSVSAEEKSALHPYLAAPGKGMPVIRRLTVICHCCVLFFVIIPACIYLISYIPYLAPRTNIHSLRDYLDAVWQCQINMFNYHKTPGMGMDHPYYSPWYEWPFMLKPMYYAARQYLTSRTTVPFSIYCYGNPVIWWGAIPALGYCVLEWIRSHCYQVPISYELPSSRRSFFRLSLSLPFHLTAKTYDQSISFVLIGLLAAFLPWVLVPRGTYIYHYFASVPFMILFIGLALDRGVSADQLSGRIITWLFVFLAAVSFIIFFPYASGLAVSRSWLDIGSQILRIGY